ncbi:MAG: hypothetical protein LH613_13820 [Chamaesiphon sp.]|nr:hypothetical protein [Chamaesiphon sp.]
MSGDNFHADFTENPSFDDSLLQIGQSKTENGYLQNEDALKFFKKKQSDWNNILMATSSAAAMGFIGLPIVSLLGGIGTALSIELSIPIDRIVSIMEMLLDEFKEEGITIIPRVKANNGTIDLLIRTHDGRYFAFLLRSNGDSRVKWREDRQQFYTIGKGRNSKWSGLELLGDELNRMMLSFKEEKNLILGLSNSERKKAFTKAIVLTSKTRLDPNNNPERLITFGRATALRMMGKSTYYLVDRANLADFLRKPFGK